MAELTNVMKLTTHVMSLRAVPRGGGVAAAIAFLMDPLTIRDVAKAANEWVTAAMEAVRKGGEPNPWKESTDEEIAGEILRRIDERKAARANGGESNAS